MWLLTALLLLTLPVLAQQRPIVKYTVREGLVQNQVLSLLKDSRGYVWCGTWYGLSRFNGETFENYTKAEGLWNAEVIDILEDKDGYVWILPAGPALARFDGKTFERYPTPTAPHTGKIIYNANSNQVQLLTQDGELWAVKGDTMLPLNLPNFPVGKISSACYQATTDTYFLAIDGQVISYRQEKSRKITEKGRWGIEGIVHDELFLNENLPNGERVCYVLKQSIPVPYLRLRPKDFALFKPLPFPYVFSRNSSLYYVPAYSLKVEQIGESPPGFDVLSIKFLDQSVSSILWLPTEKGLWGLVLNGFKNFKDGEVPYPWSIVEDHRGKLLFMSYAKGVQEFDGQNLRFIPQKEYHAKAVKSFKPLSITPSLDSWYFHALRDQNGYCWLPEGAGLYRYKDSSWDFVRKPSGSYNLAFCIAEDSVRRKIVVASDRHFYTVDIDPPFRTDSIRYESPTFTGLIFSNVVSPTGDYWFSGWGVERYNPDGKKNASYTLENGKIPMGRVQVLYFDWKGSLWAGGAEMLCLYNPKKDCFEKVIDFKFNQYVQFIEQINSTHILIADMSGLYVLNLKQLNKSGRTDLKAFNHHNGFMGIEPGQLGSYRDSKGKIWISSSSVLSVLDPTEMHLHTSPLHTIIKRINGQRLSFIEKDEVVILAEGESMVAVQVETLGDDKPYNSQFSYRLEGEMDDWTEWQEQPVITLNNLSNGLHTLKVRSRSGDFNVHGESIATLRFRTKVAVWKSPDFYKYASLLGLLLVVALALLWRRDARKGRDLLAQQSQLEKRERTLRLLQAQTIQSQMNPHFTSNVLVAIQRQILDMEAERASDNLVKMSRLSRAYLDDSLLDKNHESFSTRDISLTREIKLLEMYVELQQLHYADRFDFALQVATELDTDSYRLPPFLIQPFVENAIVHGLSHRRERGLLRVQFRALPDEGLLCRIEDDGVGREAARIIQNKEPSEFTSVSTNLSQQRAALLNQLGYDIAIEITDLVQGTAVEIRVGYK